MPFHEKLLHSNFIIKLRNWEYWPFGIIQFPIIVYYLWLSMRARSFVFFSASNPGIVMGGMLGESKYEVLKKLPAQYLPHTFLISLPASTAEVVKALQQQGFQFPVIFKPDLGERGFMVARITSESDIETYLRKAKTNFLVQELIDLPLEFGVFYTRFPAQKHGQVTSIVVKEMLSVSGDGASTLQELILKKDRAKLQWETLRKTYGDRLKDVLRTGEKLELVSVGNHCLGTKFLDGSNLINDQLSETFDRLSQQVEGFYFGRFDLRCATHDDLYVGNFKIMELNGCGAEPAHIYDPGYTLRAALTVLFQHWKNIFTIARENVARGAGYIPLSEAYQYYRKFKAAMR